MNSRQLKATKAIALFLVFSVSQICVQASLLGTSIAPSSATSKGIATLLTRGNNPISVNGNEATSGMTIFSGAQLLTPQKVGATVRIEGLGQLDLAPDTNVSLNFDYNQVNVNLAGGYAVLTTNKNVAGLITTAEGVIARTEAAKGSSVAAQTGNQDQDKDKQDQDKDKKDKDKGGAVVPGGEGGSVAGAGAGSGTGAAAGGAAGGSSVSGLSGAAIAAISLAGGGAAAYGIYRASRGRGRNPSPGTPRGNGR